MKKEKKPARSVFESLRGATDKPKKTAKPIAEPEPPGHLTDVPHMTGDPSYTTSEADGSAIMGDNPMHDLGGYSGGEPSGMTMMVHHPVTGHPLMTLHHAAGFHPLTSMHPDRMKAFKSMQPSRHGRNY